MSVFGTTIPEAKLAFGGDGEATVEAEIVERRKDEETAGLTKDVLVQAVKQAVDQAVAQAVPAQVQAVQREQEAAQADMTRGHIG